MNEKLFDKEIVQVAFDEKTLQILGWRREVVIVITGMDATTFIKLLRNEVDHYGKIKRHANTRTFSDARAADGGAKSVSGGGMESTTDSLGGAVSSAASAIASVMHVD